MLNEAEDKLNSWFLKKQLQYLNEYYTNPKNPGAFSGLSTLIKELKGFDPKFLSQWILTQPSYTRHVYKRKKFRRNRVMVSGIDDTWQMDLMDIQNISNSNKNFRYILIIIDVFSKFAWAFPLKSKEGASVYNVLAKLFKKRKPKKIQSDRGLEFLNKLCLKLFQENSIKFYNVFSIVKACVVERLIRTLKEKMWRYFTFKNTNTYIDILSNLIHSYNHTNHRSIKMRPVDVNKSNEDEVWKNLYGFEKNQGSDNVVKLKFKIKDIVRIPIDKNKFGKGYLPNWSEELYEIDKILLRDPPVYIIKNRIDRSIINGVFYAEQLQKVITYDSDTETENIDEIYNNNNNINDQDEINFKTNINAVSQKDNVVSKYNLRPLQPSYQIPVTKKILIKKTKKKTLKKLESESSDSESEKNIPHKCPLCDKVFKSLKITRNHVETVHTKSK